MKKLLQEILGNNYNKYAGHFGNYAITTDGVGTKMKLAIENSMVDNLGYDLINHCINDLLCEFTKPKWFTGYLGLNEDNKLLQKDLLESIYNGCKAYNIKYLSGETAIMSDIYKDGQCEMVGTMIGTKTNHKSYPICDNDLVISLRSNGLHTNGYTLVRHLFADELSELTPRSSKMLKMLLTPHKCYFDNIELYLKKNINIKALAHITGGGWLNIKRVLPVGFMADLDSFNFEIPEIFGIIKSKGLDKKELYTNFNMGCGMMVIMDPEDYRIIANDRYVDVIGNIKYDGTNNNDVIIDGEIIG